MHVFRLKGISKESFETDLAVFSTNLDTDLFHMENGYFFKRSTNRSKALSTNGKIEFIDSDEPDILTCSITFEPKNLYLDLLKVDIIILILIIVGVLYSEANLQGIITGLSIFVIGTILLIIFGYFGIKSEQGTFLRLFKNTFEVHFEDHILKEKHIPIRQKSHE